MDVSNGNKRYLLLDSAADVSILKSRNIRGTVEFEQKIRMKSVEGSVIETHGGIETKIREGNVEIPFTFQLVN